LRPSPNSSKPPKREERDVRKLLGAAIVAAVLMAVIYATYNTLNYVVQLATVLPAGYTWTFEDQQGTVGPLSLLNQTPHSLFWDIDGLGYIFLNLATLLAVPALEKSGAQRWVRRFFLANGLITPVFAIAYFYPTFSVPILMIGGVPWAYPQARVVRGRQTPGRYVSRRVELLPGSLSAPCATGTVSEACGRTCDVR